MTYESRMYLRLASPWVLSGVLTTLASWVTTVLADLPVSLGAPTSPLVDAPLIVATAGAAITAGLVLRYFYRLWQWQHGKSDECLVCGCLLGPKHQARWNVGRRCLGCRKFVQTQ